MGNSSDEMNITAPQNIQTKTELEELTDVKKVLISARSSNIIMGLKQDGLLGAFNLTKKTTSIDWKTAMNLLVNLKLPKTMEIPKNKNLSGHEIFSYILPERINKSNFGLEKEPLIIGGQLISGYLGKSTLKEESPNNLIQHILDEYGADEAKDFFDNAQKIINKFNMFYGFSVGLRDTVASDKIIQQNVNRSNEEILKANVDVTEMENNPMNIDTSTFEMTIKGKLGNVMNEVADVITKNMTEDNSIYVMATSGSKGGANNTGQMIGLLGQQALEGKRIPKKIGKRGLPYFFRNDDTAKAGGYIENSFLTGLSYPEFVYHNMTSREGLIDTAIKTAETGYTQRKLIKSMEDIMIAYDGTVRTATGSIIQFIYGDNGSDTTKQYNYQIDMLLMKDEDLEKRYKFTSDEITKFKDFSKKDNDVYIEELKMYRDTIRYTQRKNKIDFETFKSYINFMLPINLTRIMDKIRNMVDNTDKISLTPTYIINKLNGLLEHQITTLVCTNRTDEKESIKLNDENVAKTIIKISLMNALSPKRCIFEYKLTQGIFDYAIEEIIKGFKRNLVEPGEMVGIIGEQALMPPLTQLTLNTFHSSGIGAKSHTTLGVPRLKELLSLTRSLKTPQMIVYLTKEHQHNKEMSHRISAYLKQTKLINIRDKIEVFYDPIPLEKGSFNEKDRIGTPFYVKDTTSNGCQQNIYELPWLVRIEFNREKLLWKDITLLDILSKFCNAWESRLQDPKKIPREKRVVLEKITRCGIACNNDNDDIPVIHIRFDMVAFTIEILTNFVDLIIDELKLKGIDSIIDVSDPIEKSYLNIETPNHEIKDTKEYLIPTNGVNMFDIRYINGVDVSRTICNDVMKVYDIFGIEAARIALLREITNMLSGTLVNYHHLSILVDLMTRDGFMISIDRHGMGRTDAAPLGKVSFEKPVEQLLLAAAFNESDPLRGVSGRIMTGNVIRGGTGLCEIMLDSEMIEKSEYTETGREIIKDVIDDSGELLIDDVVGKTQDDVFIPE
jgi:DNA-directed RNA polymerase II subunit RPB1